MTDTDVRLPSAPRLVDEVREIADLLRHEPSDEAGDEARLLDRAADALDAADRLVEVVRIVWGGARQDVLRCTSCDYDHDLNPHWVESQLAVALAEWEKARGVASELSAKIDRGAKAVSS